MPLSGLGADRAVAVRAFLFLVLSLALLRLGPSESWRLVRGRDPLMALTQLFPLAPAFLAVRSTAPHFFVTNWGVISCAAAVEEIVFRLALPHTLSRAASALPAEAWVRTWLALTVSQLSFALSHLGIGGGLASSRVESTALFTLMGAGLLLAGVRLLMGLPAAIAMHSLANVAIESHRTVPNQMRTWPAALICGAALGLLGWVARRQPEGPVATSAR